MNLTMQDVYREHLMSPFSKASHHIKHVIEAQGLSLPSSWLALKDVIALISRPLTLVFRVTMGFSLLLVTWKIAFNLFYSPLSDIPGPFLAKITTKWLTLTEVSGNRSLVVAQAHEKYGPVIRIAPDELSFSDRSCIKELYLQGSKFPKSRRYEGFASGTRASFDMTDKDQHRQRRNLVRHVLAPANINDAEPLIGDAVRKSLRWIKRSQREGESLDVVLWMRRVMLDTAGALFLGRDFSALDNDEEPEFLQWMDDFFAVTALRWFAPWISVVLKYLPVAFIQHFLGAQKRSYEYGRKAFNEYINQYGRFSGRIDLLTKMVGTPESAPLTDEEISDELGSLLVGATDTTVVVSTWMLWELAQRPGWQSRIREELHSKSVEFPNGVPSYQQIASLSILHGFIMESMRLHPAQSIGLPRVAGTSEAKLGGITVPAGVCTVPRDPLVHEIVTDSIGLRQTYVSVQSRNVHRDPEIFPSPNDFLPERWIDTSGGTNEMKDSFIIFSKGSRSCLGQYVAFMELKLVIASLLNGWSMKLGVKTTDEVMKQTDFFLAFPKARKCWLLFEKVEQ